jgi:hypothetical protein
VSREHFRAVRRAPADAAPRVLGEGRGADLGIPEDLDLLALGVVGDAGQPQRGEVRLRVVHRLYEPRAPACLDEAALLDAVAHDSCPSRKVSI